MELIKKSTVLLIFLSIGLLQSKTDVEEVKTALHHSYVFYLSENPLITKLADASSKISFFVPTLDVTKIKKKLELLPEQDCNQSYCLNIKQVKSPTKGTVLTAEYNPQKYSLQHQTFSTVSGKGGFMITFINKDTINDLKNSTNTIRKVVFNNVFNNTTQILPKQFKKKMIKKV